MPENYLMLTNILATFGGAIFIVMLIMLAIYIFAGYCLYRIAKKLNVANGWMAWIPIANACLLAQTAGFQWYWGLAVFVAGYIPTIGALLAIVGAAFFWMKTAQNLGKPNWYGILMFVPIVNLFILWEMAK